MRTQFEIIYSRIQDRYFWNEKKKINVKGQELVTYTYILVMIDNKVVRIFNQYSRKNGISWNSIETNSQLFAELKAKYEEFPITEYPVALVETMHNPIVSFLN